jgi:flagellar motor component MotA
MANLPRIIDCKYKNIYQEEIVGKLIPLSLKSQNEILEEIENLKSKQRKDGDEKIANFKSKLLNESNDLEELKTQYIKLKGSISLVEVGKEVNDEELEKFSKRYGKNLIDGKTIEDIIHELSIMSVDITNKTKTVEQTVALTIFYSLRKVENLKERIYDKLDDLLEDVNITDLYNIFSLYSQENDVKEEEVKNLQSPTS